MQALERSNSCRATPEELYGFKSGQKSRVAEIRSDERIVALAIRRIADFMKKEAGQDASVKYSEYCVMACEVKYFIPLLDEDSPDEGCDPEYLLGGYADIAKLAKSINLKVKIRKMTDDPWGVIDRRTRNFIYGIFIVITYQDASIRECERTIARMVKRKDVSAPTPEIVHSFPSH